MANLFIGKREAMSNNSTKYGYSIDGLCVKTPAGYRSINGTLVNGAVSTDASNIVKETVYLETVKRGQVIVMDAVPYNVYGVSEINPTTSRFELLNLMTGAVETSVLNIAEKAVGILWDTFEFPEKAIAGGAAAIQLNEFTPAQLRDLRAGKVTLEELRTPKTVESLESILGQMIANVVAKNCSNG